MNELVTSKKTEVVAERRRMEEDRERRGNWRRWGPYLSERQWGTVREDYSAWGSCWDYFPHDHARSRVYRWGEDGLLGICDRQCRLCFALAVWNGKDPILKERLFGLTGNEGNHGEDVKENYFYLHATPTSSYLKALYKYPQKAYPYDLLVAENRRRGRTQAEFELIDTGIFDDRRYFDVQIEYAKASPEDILILITIGNRGADPAQLHVLPTLWFRNTWGWGRHGEDYWAKPLLALEADGTVSARHESLGEYVFQAEAGADGALRGCLFTENETNQQRLFGAPNPQPYVKDAFHRYLIGGETDAINPAMVGTKMAPHYLLEVPAHSEQVIRLRLSSTAAPVSVPFGQGFDRTVEQRRAEMIEYYESLAIRAEQALIEQDEPNAHSLPQQSGFSQQDRQLMHQSFAGLFWSLQFYHLVVEEWQQGDPSQPPPPPEHRTCRNVEWGHLHSRDLILMPDKWEYPYFCAWDLAFHALGISMVDPELSKRQLETVLWETYMHPNGQIPAYEFAFSDVNPPVHAWAAFRVYKSTGLMVGEFDRVFLARLFQKLLMNFSWWVNRKDPEGRNIFGGGFLGLDNIGVFDRSKPLPTGGYLEQADGTAWMAFYCAAMLTIALELAYHDPVYEDIAYKFFEHFSSIIDAMHSLGGGGLWNEEDGFYYDQLVIGHQHAPLRVRSMVGLIPLLAATVVESHMLERMPGLFKRVNWFRRNRPNLARHLTFVDDPGAGNRGLLAVASRERLLRVLRYLLDENEFLSPYGVRSVSRYHKDHPFVFSAGGVEYSVGYLPAESDSGMFGGNSNWRGPIWFPINYLLIEALETYNVFYGDSLRVECPTGSGHMMNMAEVARELSRRLCNLFTADEHGRRACNGEHTIFATDPYWRDLIQFNEFFHGDTGRGLGASHQTGWTALVTRCLRRLAVRFHRYNYEPQTPRPD